MSRQGERIPYPFHAYRKEVMEALCQTKLSGTDFRVVLLILAQTDGYVRTQDKMKPRFFQERTAIAPPNLRRTVIRLRKWKIIHKEGSYYQVLPPNQWSTDCFLEHQKRFNLEAVSEPDEEEKRFNLEAPTASDLKRPVCEIEALLASPKENLSKENLSKENNIASEGSDALTSIPKPAPDERAPDARVKQVLVAITEKLGYQIPHYPTAGKEVKRALKNFSPEQFIACWDKMKTWPFWEGKWLPLAKVTENLGEFAAGRLRDNSYPRKGAKRVEARGKWEDFPEKF
ncbi:MAG: replication protein [Chloroflexota bacterium]